MNMAKQLPYIFVASFETQKWIVIEVYLLLPYLDAHLHCHVLEAADESLLHVFQVVVADDQIDLAVEPVKNFCPFGRTSKAEVAKMEYDVIRTDNGVPVADQFLVHLLCASEWTVTVPDDVCVVEVGVRSEEHPASIKSVIHNVVVYVHHCA